MTIDDVVQFEQQPRDWTAVRPFSVTVHTPEKLTAAEKAAIQDAIVTAASRIRRMRRADTVENFYWSDR